MDPGMEALAGLVADARERAGLDGAPADVAVYGLAGADTPGDTRRLGRALARHRFALVDDVLNDAFPGVGDQAGERLHPGVHADLLVGCRRSSHGGQQPAVVGDERHVRLRVAAVDRQDHFSTPVITIPRVK